MKAPFVIGRMMFGGFFLYTGIDHFLHGNEIAKYADTRGVPKADLAVQASGVALMVGGASILLGVKPKLGAAALIGFLAAASPGIHNFWADEDPQQRKNDIAHFAKNLALAGGALALAGVDEPWPVSVPATKTRMLKRAAKSAWHVLAA